MTAFVLALVMAAALAVTAYAASVTVKYRVYVYSDEITFRQYDYSQSTSPTVINMTISATSSLGSGSALYHMKYADGAVAYCIEPGVHSDDSGTYKEGSSASWYNLPASVQSGIALAMSLGYPSADYGAASGDRNSSAIINAEKWAATQAIIWELICEYRNAYTYDDWGYSPFYGCVDTSRYQTFGLWYDKIAAALMAIGLMTTAFAATDSAPTIDPGKKASLSIYKYDITTAGKDGAWDAESYVSTGLHNNAVIDKLSKYAIQGVEFTYLRVADITMNNELVNGQRQVGVLYAGLWSSERISEMLQNETYIGNMVQGRQVKISYKSKKCLHQERENWVVVENTHEPLIDAESFRKVRMLVNSRKHTRSRTYDFLLKGLVFCHECGYPLAVINRPNAKGEDALYFVCRTYQRFTKAGVCSCHSIKEARLTEAVLDKVREVCKEYLKPQALLPVAERAVKEASQEEKAAAEIAALQGKITSLTENLDRMYTDRLSGLLPETDFQRIFTRIKEERGRLEERIRDLEQQQKSPVSHEDRAKELVQRFLNAACASRELLVSLIERIELTEDKEIIIKFRFAELQQAG